MYFVVVILTTVILPIGSAVIELLLGSDQGPIATAGKWFVFWAVGIRLLMAGLSQVLRPSFTASEILAVKEPGAAKTVSELGYANVSMGLISGLSLLLQAWTAPQDWREVCFSASRVSGMR